MKRDMDLVRQLLLQVEEDELPSSGKLLKAIGESDENWAKVDYHLTMLVDEVKYLEGIPTMSPTGVGNGYLNLQLTWAGHEFLDTMRDPTVWEKTKKVAASAGGTTVKVLMDVGTAIVKEAAKDQLRKMGIPL